MVNDGALNYLITIQFLMGICASETESVIDFLVNDINVAEGKIVQFETADKEKLFRAKYIFLIQDNIKEFPKLVILHKNHSVFAITKSYDRVIQDHRFENFSSLIRIEIYSFFSRIGSYCFSLKLLFTPDFQDFLLKTCFYLYLILSIME
jgi:hypothetical protein